jgi:hypothetical protein
MSTGADAKPKSGYFDHERWDVYQAALELVILISDIVEQLSRGKAYLADQLQRAGTSVPLNIYRTWFKNWPVGCAKAPGLSDRIWGLYFLNTTPISDRSIAGAFAAAYRPTFEPRSV